MGFVVGPTRHHPPLRQLGPEDFSRVDRHRMSLVGLPIGDDHKEDYAAGRIIDQFTTAEGDGLLVIGLLHGRTQTSRNVIRDILTGQKTELSLTHEFDTKINHDGTEVQIRTPREVSVTKKGWRDHCQIRGILPIPLPDVHKRTIMASAEAMTTEQQVPPAPDSSTGAPAEPLAAAAPTGVALDLEAIKSQVDTTNLSNDQIMEVVLKMAQDKHAVQTQLQDRLASLEEENARLLKSRELQSEADAEQLLNALRESGVEPEESMMDVLKQAYASDNRNYRTLVKCNAEQARINTQLRSELENFRRQEAASRAKSGASAATLSSLLTQYTSPPTQQGGVRRFSDSAYSRAAAAPAQPAQLPQQQAPPSSSSAAAPPAQQQQQAPPPPPQQQEDPGQQVSAGAQLVADLLMNAQTRAPQPSMLTMS